MRQKIENSSDGVSNLIGTLLIIVLVIGLAAVVAAFLMPNFLQKSVYIASEVRSVTLYNPISETSVEIIGLLPKAGDPFYIIGQTAYKSGTPVSVRALSPDGRILNPTFTGSAGNLYGRQLYLYPVDTSDPASCDCILSDVAPPGQNPMVKGRWTIQFVDEDTHILVMSNSDGVITNGINAARAWLGGTPGGSVYRADCSILANSSYGINANRPALFNSTMNMSYRTFDGSTQYYTYPNDPSLTFTGDLTISMWLNPLDLGSNVGDSGLWHQIIGKGQLQGTTENDNYQLVAISKQLYFEWTDPGGQHFHIQTDGPALTEGAWQYVTLTVSDGIPRIMVNGVDQPLKMYTGNNPNSATLAPTGQKVKLRDNTLPMSMGRQNTDPYSETNSFYYQGNIGDFGLYNRALTPQEISQNYQKYNA